jgi:predicted nucleotidyltransferase
MDIPFGNKQFTHQGDPEIEKYIRDLLERITSLILMKINPVAVFLYGSLGREEGTLYWEDGRLIMPSDFEIGIVSKKWSDRKKLRALMAKVENHIGHEVTLSFFFPKRVRLATNSNFTFFPSSVPTIESYEISESAFFLYGNDLRTKKSFLDPEFIPLWEGLRLLFNRMAEFVIAFQSGSKNDQIKTYNKMKIACGDAVLVTIHNYHYLYRQRLDNLQKYWEEIQKRNPGLKHDHFEFIRKGYAWKLVPQENLVAMSNSDYGRLSEIVGIILSYVTNIDMNITFIDSNEFSRKYLENPKLKKEYYKGISGHPLMQNLISFLQRRIPFKIYLNNIGCQQSLIHRVYAYIPGIFFEQLGRLTRKQSVTLCAKDQQTLEMYGRLLA